MSPYQEAAELQKAYRGLVLGKKLTKKAMCDLCIPFRDKYNLSDKEVLMVARNELTLNQLVTIFEKYDNV